ncbi:hypothetical protein [Actinoplanes rectilineatus]|uniref:hypothetical protein n=1 Tax=Actinoplanes rectilineatus TaxID=113571 RepID=UPI0005F294C7|nr:hypothetical protein [Actinoplanes rectilineatus]
MSAPMSEFPPGLLDYFAARQQQRDKRADTAWRTLTKFERRVTREAAVMGYVLGYRAGQADGVMGKGGPLDNDDPIPGDIDIVRRVIQHCDSTSDLYPYLGEACEGRRRRITRKRMYPGEASPTSQGG